MKEHTLRLVVPSALGFLAFGLNSLTISKAIEPIQVLAVNGSVAPGDRLEEQVLEAVQLPGQSQVMRTNFIPASARSTVLRRKVYRALEPNQLLLYSDLNTQLEVPIPDGCELFFVAIDNKKPFQHDLLQTGARVYFVLKAEEGQTKNRIGPYEIFEAPVGMPEGTVRKPTGAENAVGVLLDPNQPELAKALRDAVSRDAVRGIELEPR